MRVALILTTMLLAAGLVTAGSASEPEITDPAADATTGGQPGCPGGAAACAGPAQVIDIIAAWIIEADDRLTFAVQTSGSEAHKAYGPMDFDAVFTVAGTEFTAGIHLGQSSTAGGDDAVEPRGIASDARIGADQYEFTVMRADLGAPAAGDVLDGFYMTSKLNNAGTGANSADRAPDADGVTFTFALGADEPAPPTQLNVTGEELVHEFVGNGTDAAFLINWAGPANVTMDLMLNGTGNVTLNVTAPSGDTVFACNCTDGTMEAFSAEAGNWTIHIDYKAFNGTANLVMSETVAAPASEEPEGTEGNQTAAPEDEDGEDAPLPVAMLLAGIAVAAVIRRR